MPETSPGVEGKVGNPRGPEENATPQISVASYRGIEAVPRISLPCSLGSEHRTSSIGYPKALAEWPSGLPQQVKADRIIPALNLKASEPRIYRLFL